MNYFGYRILHDEAEFKRFRSFYINYGERFHWDMKNENLPVYKLYGRHQRRADAEGRHSSKERNWGWEA